MRHDIVAWRRTFRNAATFFFDCLLHFQKLQQLLTIDTPHHTQFMVNALMQLR